VRLEVTYGFAIPLRDGFDYIVEPRNWPEYWPGLVRVQPGSRWRAPGDRARVVMRLLGRTVELEMTPRTFARYRLIEYTSVQQGLPDVRHERGFSAAGDGFEYRLAVEFEPRPGCAERSTAGLSAVRSSGRCRARTRTSRAACSASARSPLNVARQFEDAVPDAKLVVIPGAGHVSNLEQPELFNDAVRKFCRAHSPRSV
jgi:pimeloyl-ACP methyl ester carboxylesterase